MPEIPAKITVLSWHLPEQPDIFPYTARNQDIYNRPLPSGQTLSAGGRAADRIVLIPQRDRPGPGDGQIIFFVPYRGSSFIVPSGCMIRTIAGSGVATGAVGNSS